METGKTAPKLLSFILGICALVGTAILFWFDPSQHGFYPRCIFHQVTGYLCPGCGALRAMHQLLHGNLAAAWHFNPLLIASLPLFAVYGLVVFWRKHLRRPAPEFRLAWIWTGVAIILIFGVARNLPLGN